MNSFLNLLRQSAYSRMALNHDDLFYFIRNNVDEEENTQDTIQSIKNAIEDSHHYPELMIAYLNDTREEPSADGFNEYFLTFIRECIIPECFSEQEREEAAQAAAAAAVRNRLRDNDRCEELKALAEERRIPNDGMVHRVMIKQKNTWVECVMNYDGQTWSLTHEAGLGWSAGEWMGLYNFDTKVLDTSVPEPDDWDDEE
jgi:hypothetical protein